MNEQAAARVCRRLLELFRGREGVYAEHDGNWHPVHRPLTEEDLKAHLNGKRALGVYVVRSNNTVTFATLDFDNREDPQSTLELALRARRAAEGVGIPATSTLLVFSGHKGHHLHFFFDKPLPAAVARRLLQIVCELVGLPDETEIFPKQDQVEEGGLGNLIKLPLCRHPATHNVSGIVDRGHHVEPVPSALVYQVVASHQHVLAPPSPDHRPPRVPDEDDGRPGSDFNARADWAKDLLEPAGWSFTGRRGGYDHWYRETGGRQGWTSATITPDGQYLYVFSTSTRLPANRALSKFTVYAHLFHEGDFRKAANELAQRGYGRRRTVQLTGGSHADRDWHEGVADADGHADGGHHGNGASDLTASGPGKPRVICTNRSLADKTSEALHHLVQNNDPPRLFVRNRRLVRIGHSKETPEGAPLPVIELLIDDALREMLADVADFLVIRQKGDTTHGILVSPPLDIVKAIQARGEWPELPSLAEIVESPVVRRDGSILDKPGYDAATWLYYAPPPGFALEPIPEWPTGDDVRQARTLLSELYCDFPFADRASRANALAPLIEPLIRHALPPEAKTPCAIYDAPTPGSGKGLMLDATWTVVSGHEAPKNGATGTDEELDKRIAAALLSGARCFVLDNVSRPIEFSSLDRALTSGTYQGRVLGTNQALIARLRWSWAITGNNVKLGGDLARRCYWIRIVPQVSDPEARPPEQFRHPRLEAWAREHRSELLRAVLILIRSWYADGRPKAEVPIFGSFEAWAETIGSILTHAGIEGFLENLLERKRQSDTDREQWEAFIAAWWSLLGEEPICLSELTQRLLTEEDYLPLKNTLPDRLALKFDQARSESHRSFDSALGRHLVQREQRRFGSEPPLRWVKRHQGHANTTTWRVVAQPPEEDPGSDGEPPCASDAPSQGGPPPAGGGTPKQTAADAGLCEDTKSRQSPAMSRNEPKSAGLEREAGLVRDFVADEVPPVVSNSTLSEGGTSGLHSPSLCVRDHARDIAHTITHAQVEGDDVPHVPQAAIATTEARLAKASQASEGAFPSGPGRVPTQTPWHQEPASTEESASAGAAGGFSESADDLQPGVNGKAPPSWAGISATGARGERSGSDQCSDNRSAGCEAPSDGGQRGDPTRPPPQRPPRPEQPFDPAEVDVW